MTSPSSGQHRGQVPSPAPAEPSPVLRIVRGGPSPEELAALTVVVAALSQRRTRRRPTPVGTWSSFGDAHRRPLRPGPGGWRASGRYA
jgi:hypothetical protein